MVKKILKTVGIVLGCVVLIALIYVGYIFATFSRIEDNQMIEPERSESGLSLASVETGKEYSIVTYNVGFGAYSPDYSFFMDGGTESWAFSKEDVIKNIDGAGQYTKSFSPDFVMLEEIDDDGTRSYHVDELSQLKGIFDDYQSAFAVNYHSKFLMYPITQPHGANHAGIALFSKYTIDSAVRRSLPISSGFSKVFDLDRCYEIARVPAANGKELVLVTVHLSAYSDEEAVREGQLEMLFGDLKAEYEKGNYVICGGDFNHDLELAEKDDNPELMSWTHSLPRGYLGESLKVAVDDYPEVRDNQKNTCRDAVIPYDPEESFTVTVDGFIVSDNVEVTGYEHLDTGFAYSDHDPVYMKFILK